MWRAWRRPKNREEIDMALLLLSVAAVIEATTGIALIISPQTVTSLLLGADLAVAGIAVGRVAGIALLSLGLGCWLSRRDLNKTAALAAMLSYKSAGDGVSHVPGPRRRTGRNTSMASDCDPRCLDAPVCLCVVQ
jgi:hypothetical protein